MDMRSAQVSELKDRLDEVIEAVKNGETVQIRDGEKAVAELVPSIADPVTADMNSNQQALEANLDELVRQGKARRGTGTLPDDFFTRPLAESRRSVLEALLEDRRSD
jgi:antitoxin (DNA-binding transcriptional repressor) of toxin-antitoxin stability system